MPVAREGRQRLSEKGQIHPFVRAPESKSCELYWISVSAFPIPTAQRAWLMEFSQSLGAALGKEHGLRGEFFLLLKTVHLVEKRFLKLAVDLLPILGLARKPHAPLPPLPTQEQLQAAARGEPFDINQHIPDFCYWLRHSDPGVLLGEFFGHGGSAMYYLKADPATKPPEIPYLEEIRPLFPQMDFGRLQLMMQAALAMRDGFLKSSKQILGEGLEQEPQYDGLSYIVPLLETKDFFSQPDSEREKWFKLFDVFWRESPADQGIYLASALPLEPLLVPIVESMKEAGRPYPQL